MDAGTQTAVERALGSGVIRADALSGGIAPVWKATLADGRAVAIKTGGATLETEARTLAWLTDNTALPLPDVLHAEAGLLVLAFVPSDGRVNEAAEYEAADLLAALHTETRSTYGFAFETALGGLAQPNPESPRWLPFFRDHRLCAMAAEAERAGQLSATLRGRVENLAARLDDIIDEPAQPGLIHGDVWGGNVLVRDGRIAAFLDPAAYFADSDMELAFIDLFVTFGRDFQARYRERRTVRPGYKERSALYTLYPLLVHVRLFGGRYVGAVEGVLRRFGV